MMENSAANDASRRVEEWAMDVPIWRVPRRALLFAVATFIVVAVFFTWLATRRLTATIVNVDSSTIAAVIVHVTGHAYPIGDLAPDKALTLNIQLTSESHIEIEFLDARKTKRVVAGCYLEPGNKGNVLVELNREGVVRVVDTTTRY